MAPFRAARSTRSGRQGAQSDFDIVDGLPVRQWRLQEAPVGVESSLDSATDNNAAAEADNPAKAGQWSELPMPRGSQLYAPWCQQLLRAARAGRLQKRRRDLDHEDDHENDASDDHNHGDVSKQGFLARRWAQVPRNMEDTEPEYLSRRRKGLSSTQPGFINAMPSVYGDSLGVDAPEEPARKRMPPPRKKQKKGPVQKKKPTSDGEDASAVTEGDHDTGDGIHTDLNQTVEDGLDGEPTVDQEDNDAAADRMQADVKKDVEDDAETRNPDLRGQDAGQAFVPQKNDSEAVPATVPVEPFVPERTDETTPALVAGPFAPAEVGRVHEPASELAPRPTLEPTLEQSSARAFVPVPEAAIEPKAREPPNVIAAPASEPAKPSIAEAALEPAIVSMPTPMLPPAPVSDLHSAPELAPEPASISTHSTNPQLLEVSPSETSPGPEPAIPSFQTDPSVPVKNPVAGQTESTPNPDSSMAGVEHETPHTDVAAEAPVPAATIDDHVEEEKRQEQGESHEH